jgi:hypothetical protein
MGLEVDEEDDLNWAFINNLLLTDPDPLQSRPSQRDEDIQVPNITFSPKEIALTNAYWAANPAGLQWDKDIYSA